MKVRSGRPKAHAHDGGRFREAQPVVERQPHHLSLSAGQLCQRERNRFVQLAVGQQRRWRRLIPPAAQQPDCRGLQLARRAPAPAAGGGVADHREEPRLHRRSSGISRTALQDLQIDRLQQVFRFFAAANAADRPGEAVAVQPFQFDFQRWKVHWRRSLAHVPISSLDGAFCMTEKSLRRQFRRRRVSPPSRCRCRGNRIDSGE